MHFCGASHRSADDVAIIIMLRAFVPQEEICAQEGVRRGREGGDDAADDRRPRQSTVQPVDAKVIHPRSNTYMNAFRSFVCCLVNTAALGCTLRLSRFRFHVHTHSRELREGVCD